MKFLPSKEGILAKARSLEEYIKKLLLVFEWLLLITISFSRKVRMK